MCLTSRRLQAFMIGTPVRTSLHSQIVSIVASTIACTYLNPHAVIGLMNTNNA
jgi:hypothetical protein